MAHELEIINGKASMFFRGDNPWHNLGTFIHPDKKLTSQERYYRDWETDRKSTRLNSSH